MKKAKVLMIVLVVAVMVIGAGYAYWSETLTINNTVSTGEFNMEFTEALVADYDIGSGKINLNSDNYISTTAGITDNNHKINFSIGDIYPGGGSSLAFNIKNTGTVPAELRNLTSNIKSGNELKDVFDYSISGILVYRLKENNIGKFEWEEIEIIGAEAPILAQTFDGFVNSLGDALSGYTLEPEAYFKIYLGRIPIGNSHETDNILGGYGIHMPYSVEDDNFEGKTFNFELMLNFEQPH